MKYSVVLGTRPETIKLSGVIRYLEKENKDFFIIHSNQHYSENLDAVFFKELELNKPKYNLNIGSGSHGAQTGKMLCGIEEILLKEKPDVVIVQGDTNTVLSGALAASKLHIDVAHIEAGLRSNDMMMPEELNRIMTDHISKYLFAPTDQTKQNLLNEGLDPKKVFVTGNTIVDAVIQNLELAEKRSEILKKLNLEKKNYILLTSHRAENTDVESRLKGIIDGAQLLSEKLECSVIYPIHPRTKKMIEKYNLELNNNFILVDPLGFLDFIFLQKNARIVLTDSGGLQEESCILRVPCVTLRDNTERPETLDVGSNILAGTDPRVVLTKSLEMLQRNNNWSNPFGDGHSSKYIIDHIDKSS